jgi:hypothetical protein
MKDANPLRSINRKFHCARRPTGTKRTGNLNYREEIGTYYIGMCKNKKQSLLDGSAFFLPFYIISIDF